MMLPRAVVLAVFVCAGAGRTAAAPGDADADASAKRYGAPVPTAQPYPWKVGQWVAYKRTTGGTIGEETIRLVAQDACGWWFELGVEIEGDQRELWQFCVTALPAPHETRLADALGAVVERRNGNVVRVGDFRTTTANRAKPPAERAKLAWLVERVHASWPAQRGLTQTDVATATGTFERAFEQARTTASGTATRWSHPAVPLGGVVREVAGDTERMLVRFGMTTHDSPLVDGALALERHQRAQQRAQVGNNGRLWFVLHSGGGAFGATGDPARASGGGSVGGFRITSALDITLAGFNMAEAGTATDTDPTEELMTIVAGVRWHPWGRVRRPRPPALLAEDGFYLQAELGYAHVWQRDVADETSTSGQGVVTGARVGLALLKATDWATGFELLGHLAVVTGDERLRSAFGLQAFIQLWTP